MASTPACNGARSAAASPDASTATSVYQAPAPAADAGTDARFDAAPTPVARPDGGKPVVPPPNYACRDLSRCCSAIKSSLERAACVAVVLKATPSVCTTALIGYQIVGCGHAPISFDGILSGLPGTSHDKDKDGVPDFVDENETPSYTFESYCAAYPDDYGCGGGTGAYDTDPCIANPSAPGCATDPFFPGDPTPSPSDPYADPYGGDPYAGDPYAGDPYAGDPYAPPADDGSGGSGGDEWWW